VEAFEDHDDAGVKKWAGIIADRIDAATHLLLAK
jgi:hypothetical protein